MPSTSTIVSLLFAASTTLASSHFPHQILPRHPSNNTPIRSLDPEHYSNFPAPRPREKRQSAQLPCNTPQSEWILQADHRGETFFDNWSFFTKPDPTNGDVDYVSQEVALESELIEINERGNAIMRLQTDTVVPGNRKAIRIEDKFHFDGGLVIIDAVHMPFGCGTWPAFWTYGPNWPYDGEIDLIEFVHDSAINQASIHTGSGCHIPEDTPNMMGPTNCASYETGNTGCGIADRRPNVYGKNFNLNGGGVYAMKLDETGVFVWFFPRDGIPSDIGAGKPRPESWSAPFASYPSTNCITENFFRNHKATFTNTLCGDWAGNDWWQCQQTTGYSSCRDYVRANGDKLVDAFWEVKYVKVYQKAGQTWSYPTPSDPCTNPKHTFVPGDLTTTPTGATIPLPPAATCVTPTSSASSSAASDDTETNTVTY